MLKWATRETNVRLLWLHEIRYLGLLLIVLDFYLNYNITISLLGKLKFGLISSRTQKKKNMTAQKKLLRSKTISTDHSWTQVIHNSPSLFFPGGLSHSLINVLLSSYNKSTHQRITWYLLPIYCSFFMCVPLFPT